MKNTIALYIGSLAIGGAERVISQLANGLVAMEYRIILITTYQKMNEYAIRDGVERIILDQGSTTHNGLGKNIKYIMQIREICRNNNVAIIISFMREPNVRALLATVGLRTKNIISVRNDPLREYPGFIGKLICKCLFPIADACVFQTEKAKSFFPVGIRKKSRVILNPIAKEFFSVKRNDLQNVVTVCRLEQQKNIGLLIRAFAKIEKEYPAEKLLIYGEGEQKRELKALIDKLKLGERIKLMGRVTNIPEVLSKAKVFVLSSNFEGLPNALMEALAVGVPSIATDCPCGGPRMLIDNGVNGILVPVGDEDKMTETLDVLLSDSEYALRLGVAAAARADAQFRPDIIIEQWRELIKSIVT